MAELRKPDVHIAQSVDRFTFWSQTKLSAHNARVCASIGSDLVSGRTEQQRLRYFHARGGVEIERVFHVLSPRTIVTSNGCQTWLLCVASP